MNTQDAIAALHGQLAIENSNLTATQQRIAAIEKAVAVLENGYQSDQDAIADAVTAKLEAAKAALTS